MIPTLIFALSAISMWFVHALLALPEPHQLLALPLTTVVHDVPDTTLDWIGLV